MLNTWIRRAMALAVTTGLTAASAAAQTPEEFYTGKTVELTVGATPGGSADTIARTFVEHLAKHFPGNPEIVVFNKPGAGGMVAAKEMMAGAKRDGTAMAMLLGGSVFVPRVEGIEDQFDPREVNWVGSIDVGAYPYVILANDQSPVKTANEIFEKEMAIAATSFTHQNRTIPEIMNRYLGAKFNIIPGYKGSPEIYLAMERREVDGWMLSYASLLDPGAKAKEWVADGTAFPLITIGFEHHPAFPDVPLISEFITSDEQTKLLEFFFTPLIAGRPIVFPPEVPADRVAAIRKAFDETAADEAFIADMRKRMGVEEVATVDGAGLQELVAEVYAAPDSVLEAARDILTDK